MSVVGFDFGNQSCYVAVARQGGIEVITNDYSLHATPSCVSFGPRCRSMGVASRQQINSNFKNTVINFKHLIGRRFSDSITQKLRPFIPCDVVQLPDDNIGFKVEYLGETRVFTPEQILAALLVKLKEITEASMGDHKKVVDCVVAVPFYFTDTQRRSLLAAIEMAELNGLRIINETTAVALAYGIYKTDLPAEGEAPRVVAFVDIGQSATQAVLVAFNKGRLAVLGSAFDMDVSGQVLDAVIRDHFRELFLKNFGVDAASSGRAWLRLLDECEKLKKQMSANSTTIPLNIECFLNDKDVSGTMQRSEFETLVAGVMSRLDRMLRSLLDDSKMSPADVESVEVIGGSSRVPIMKRVIADVFGKEPKTTMNQDDTVARGAAMQCAILSPSFRVREFNVKDSQPFRIKLAWGSFDDGGENDIFHERDEFPYSKMLTLYRKEPFAMTAAYSLPNQVPHEKREIGSWKANLAACAESRKVKVKVRINPNGIFTVCSATIFDVLAASTPTADNSQAIDTQSPAKPAANGSQGINQNDDSNKPMQENGDEKSDPGEKEMEEEKTKPGKTKKVATELQLEETTAFPYSPPEMTRFIEFERQMRQTDLNEKRKADSKNVSCDFVGRMRLQAVEEYIFEMRHKLSESLKDFVTEQDCEYFNGVLTKTEDWLYGDGEETSIKAYEDQLAELKKLGDPILERYREHEAREPAAHAFGHALQMAQKEFDLYVAGDEKYSHLESKQMEKVVTAIEEKRHWLDDSMNRQAKRAKWDVPVVFAREILEQKQAFENIIRPILSKPKPKPPAKTEPASGEANATGATSTDATMEVD